MRSMVHSTIHSSNRSLLSIRAVTPRFTAAHKDEVYVVTHSVGQVDVKVDPSLEVCACVVYDIHTRFEALMLRGFGKQTVDESRRLQKRKGAVGVFCEVDALTSLPAALLTTSRYCQPPTPLAITFTTSSEASHPERRERPLTRVTLARSRLKA